MRALTTQRRQGCGKAAGTTPVRVRDDKVSEARPASPARKNSNKERGQSHSLQGSPEDERADLLRRCASRPSWSARGALGNPKPLSSDKSIGNYFWGYLIFLRVLCARNQTPTAAGVGHTWGAKEKGSRLQGQKRPPSVSPDGEAAEFTRSGAARAGGVDTTATEPRGDSDHHGAHHAIAHPSSQFRTAQIRLILPVRFEPSPDRNEICAIRKMVICLLLKLVQTTI
jgi:hypothetical protein